MTTARAITHLANLYAAAWPSSHPLDITAALHLVSDKMPERFEEILKLPSESAAVEALATAIKLIRASDGAGAAAPTPGEETDLVQ